MIEALIWAAAGAAFYHFCPIVARGIWDQLKKIKDWLPF